MRATVADPLTSPPVTVDQRNVDVVDGDNGGVIDDTSLCRTDLTTVKVSNRGRRVTFSSRRMSDEVHDDNNDLNGVRYVEYDDELRVVLGTVPNTQSRRNTLDSLISGLVKIVALLSTAAVEMEAFHQLYLHFAEIQDAENIPEPARLAIAFLFAPDAFHQLALDRARLLTGTALINPPVHVLQVDGADLSHGSELTTSAPSLGSEENQDSVATVHVDDHGDEGI